MQQLIQHLMCSTMYRRGLQGGNFGLGTAVGLFNSVIALIIAHNKHNKP